MASELLDLLEACGFQFPCRISGSCDCMRIPDVLQRTEDPFRLWKLLLSEGEGSSCRTWRKLHEKTHGTTCRTAFCYACHCHTLTAYNEDFSNKIRVQTARQIISWDALTSLRTSDEGCVRCGSPKVLLSAFGDIPTVALVECNAGQRVRSGTLLPARIQLRDGFPQLSKPDDAMQGAKYLPFLQRPRGDERRELEFFLTRKIKVKSPTNCSSPAEYISLQMMRLGKSLRPSSFFWNLAPGGIIPVSKSLSILRITFLHDYNPSVGSRRPQTSESGSQGLQAASPLKKRKLSSSDDDAEVSADSDDEQVDTDEGSIEESLIEEQEEERDDESLQEEEEEVTQTIHELLQNIGDHALAFDIINKGLVPLLTAPWEELPVVYKSLPSTPNNNVVSLEEATREISMNPWKFFCFDHISQPSLELRSALPHVRNQLFLSLVVCVDVDSLDFITVASGGGAFRNSRAGILRRWDPRYANTHAPQRNNNNFVLLTLPDPARYPGEYFQSANAVSRTLRGLRRASNQPTCMTTPVHLQVFQLETCLSRHPLKVYACVPSGVLRCLIRGQNALLKFFATKIECNHHESLLGAPDSAQRSRVRSDDFTRHDLFKLVWYMATEFTSFCISKSTIVGAESCVQTRNACCAIPSKKNSGRHNRSKGRFSSYNEAEELPPGFLTIALGYQARFLRALEQLLGVPEDLTCRNFVECPEQYVVDEGLYSLCSKEGLACIKAPIGSNECFDYFTSLWTREHGINEIMTFHEDPTRFGDECLPSPTSNKEAQIRGHLILPDLLILCHILYRGTIHGAKRTCHSSKNITHLHDRLRQELDPSCFNDGIIDVAYTIKCPRDLTFGVLLKTGAALQRLLIPKQCRSKLTSTSLKAYITTSLGFPASSGFVTRTGVAENLHTCISPSSLRRVKAYSSKWRGDNFRGQSIYDIHSKELVTLLDPSILMNLSSGMQGRACAERQRDSETSFEKLDSTFEKMRHDVALRESHISQSQSELGIRVELTHFTDSSFSCLQKAKNLLLLQEKRDSLSASDAELEFETNISKWPWWMFIPLDDSVYPDKGIENAPVILLESSRLLRYSITLEKMMLHMSFTLLREATALTSDGNTIISHISEFSRNFYEQMSLPTFWRFISLLVRGFVHGSQLQVDSKIVNLQDYSVVMPHFSTSACGFATSFMLHGIPKVVISRLLSCYQGFFSASSSARNSTNRWIFSAEDLITAARRDDIYLPSALQLKILQRMPQWRKFIQGRSNVLENASPFFKYVNLAQNCFLDSLQVCYASSLTRASSETFRRDCNNAAIITTRFLIKDLFDDLQQIGGPLQRMRGNAAKVKTLQGSIFDMKDEDIDSLRRAVCQRRYWLQNFRIDTRQGDLSSELEELSIGFRRDIEASVYEEQDPYSSSSQMHVSNFVQRLWSLMSSRTSNMFRYNKKDQKHSMVLYWLRAIMDVLVREAEKIQDFNSQSHGISNFFQQEFGELLSGCLRSAGFQHICPLLPRPEEPCLPEMSLFGKFQFGRVLFNYYPVVLPFETVSIVPSMGLVSFGHVNQELFETLQCVKTSLERLLRRRKSFGKHSQEFRRTTDRFVAEEQALWRNDSFLDALSYYRRNLVTKHQESYELDMHCEKWICEVFNHLTLLRSKLGNEGIAAWKGSDGEPKSIRKFTWGREVLPHNWMRSTEIFSKPWSDGLYPNPYEISGRSKAHSRVTRVVPFLNSTGLLFRTSAKSAEEFFKRKNRGGTHEENAQFCLKMIVDDVKRCFKDDNVNIRSNWRLSPTIEIIALLLDYDHDIL